MPIIGSASVQIRAVDKFFERDVRAAVRKIKNVEIELKADVDLTKVNKKLADLRYRMRNNIIKLNIDAQTESIEKDFDRIVQRFDGQRITLQGDADTLRAETQLALASRSRHSNISARIDPATQKALKGLFYTITGSIPFDKVKAGLLGLAGNFEGITIKGAAVVSVISAIASGLFSLTGSAFTLGSDLSDVIGIAAALPAGLFMVGTAAAAATIGWKGFTKAVGGDAKALAKLPKEAQVAAAALKGLGTSISKPVQKAFWVELGGSLESMAKTTVPVLREGLVGTAKAMGGLTKDAFQSFEKFVKTGGLATMFDGSNQGLQNMRKGMDPLITAFGKLGVVGSKLLPQFGDWMGDLGVKFGNFIDQAGEDKITGWIMDAVQTIQLLGSSISSTAKIFSGISAAANEAGFGGLRAFADGLAHAAEVANREPFKSQMVNFFNAAGEASKVFNASLSNLFKTLGSASQVLGGFFQQGVGVVSAFIDNISSMLRNSDFLAGLYVGISDFKSALKAMEPGFISLGNIVGTVARIAGTVFTAMAPGFNDIMNTLDQVFKNLLPGLEAVIPIFNAFVQAVLSVASGPIIALADGVGSLLEGFAQMPGFLQIIVMSLGAIILMGPRLTALFKGIGDGFSTMRGRLDGDVEGLGAGARRTVGHFSAMNTHLQSVGNAFRAMPFAAATSGIGGIGTAAGGAAKSILGAGGRGLMGAASGLMGLMGGPFGVALAGATALIGMYGAAQEESKQKTEALSQTLDKQTGQITNSTKALLATNALDGATNDWDNFWRGAMQGAKSTEETLSKLGTTTKEYTDKLADSRTRDDYVKGFERIRDAMRNGVPVTEEMARAVGSTKEALAGLNDDDIAHLGEKAKNAADELSKAEAKTKALAAATGLTNANATVFAKNLETLGSASTSASDKFSALKSNLDLLSGGMNGIVNTKKGLAQALDDSKKGLDALSDGGKVALNTLYSVKDGFDFSTQAGRDFHTSLESSTDAILKNGTAAMDQALKSGKSASEANSIAIQAMQPGVEALRSQLASLGVEQPKIDAIIRSFGLMPDQIATAVEVNGTEEAQRKIFLTKLAADSFANGRYESVLGALPEAAKQAIADATGKGKEFAEGNYDAVLEALDKTAGGKEAALAAILSVTNGNYDAAIKALNLTAPGTEAAKAMIASVKDHQIKITAANGVGDVVYTVKTQLASLTDKNVNITTYYSSRGTGEAGSGRQTAGGMNGAILNSVTGRSSLFQGNFPMQKLNKYANGGFENHTAQFAKAGAMRLWAEPETGGEAYIPLAKSKRKRSLEILEEVARIFGFGLYNAQYANGGIEKATTESTRPTAATTGPGTNIEFNVFPSAGLNEEQTAKYALDELYWKLTNK